MQRDMKIGMAVGVALIGIVGALFFRREPETKDKAAPPPLKDTTEIDRQIAEKGKGPYMNGVEEFPDSVAPVPPTQNSNAKAGNASDARSLAKDEELRNRERISRQGGAPASPVPLPKDDPLSTDTAPAHNRDWQPVESTGKKSSQPQRVTPAGSSVGTGRTHVIQAGDTLSGLAARYLGSSARYREIYEANRNVLRSPDDLRDGVTIVIPDGAKPRDSQPTAGNSNAGNLSAGNSTTGSSTTGNPGVKARKASIQSGEAEPEAPAAGTTKSGDAPREAIRFVPVNRGPFSAGRTQSLGGASKADTMTGRKSGTNRADSIDDDR